jgi:glutamate synthase (ferredoxin)
VRHFKQFNAKLFAARKIANMLLLSQKYRLPILLLKSSTTTIIYKGLLMPEDISRYYTDLTDTDLDYKTSACTPTFFYQHLSFLEISSHLDTCATTEINTLRGNISRMRAREELMQSDVFGDDIKNSQSF